MKYVDTDVPTSALTCKIADDIVILKTNTQKEGRKEGLTEGWAKGKKRVVCDMISRLTAKGYSKQDVITTVTELTHFTAEEAIVLYDKLFVK